MNNTEQIIREIKFKEELIQLFEKHSLCLVPSHHMEPDAHNPMLITPYDAFWKKFMNRQIYNSQNQT